MIPRRPILALAPAAAIAAGNYLVVATLLPAGQVPRAACFAWLVVGPFVQALLLAALPSRDGARVPSEPAAPPAVSWEDGALGLLGVLQHEGRLLDSSRRTSPATPTSRSEPPRGASMRGAGAHCASGSGSSQS